MTIYGRTTTVITINYYLIEINKNINKFLVYNKKNQLILIIDILFTTGK